VVVRLAVAPAILSACVPMPEVIETERVVVVEREDTDNAEIVYVPVPDVDGRIIASLVPPSSFNPMPPPALETAIGTIRFVLTGTEPKVIVRVEIGWLEHTDMVSQGVVSTSVETLFGDLTANPCRLQTRDGFVIGSGTLQGSMLAFDELALEVADEAAPVDVNIVCPITEARHDEYLMYAPVLGRVELEGEGGVVLGQTNANGGWSGFGFVRPWDDPACPLFWWGGFAHLAPGQYSTASYPLYVTPGDGISHTAPGGMEAGVIGLNGMGCGQGHILYGFQIHPMRWTEGGNIYLTRDDIRFSTWRVTDPTRTVRQTVRYPPGGGPFDALFTTAETVDVDEIAQFSIDIDFCDDAVYGAAFCATKTPVSAYTSAERPTPPPWVMEVCPYWVDRVTNVGPDTSTSGPTRSWPGPDNRCVRVEMSMD
jgi:hypothetical protein